MILLETLSQILFLILSINLIKSGNIYSTS